jgi:hypothetical protein
VKTKHYAVTNELHVSAPKKGDHQSLYKNRRRKHAFIQSLKMVFWGADTGSPLVAAYCYIVSIVVFKQLVAAYCYIASIVVSKQLVAAYCYIVSIVVSKQLVAAYIVSIVVFLV